MFLLYFFRFLYIIGIGVKCTPSLTPFKQNFVDTLHFSIDVFENFIFCVDEIASVDLVLSLWR